MKQINYSRRLFFSNFAHNENYLKIIKRIIFTHIVQTPALCYFNKRNNSIRNIDNIVKVQFLTSIMFLDYLHNSSGNIIILRIINLQRSSISKMH